MPLPLAAPVETRSDAMAGRHTGPKVTVVIRYDDFFGPEAGDGERLASRQIQLELARLHADAAIPAVFAVVPAGIGTSRTDPALAAAVKAACLRGSEIALHGYDHANTMAPARSALRAWWAAFCRRDHSELAGLQAEQQRHRLQRGKERLEEGFRLAVRVLVPPWNAYDAGTLAACRTVGITVLSASRAWPVPACGDMVFVPQTVHGQRLNEAVDYVLRRGRPAGIVCVTHPPDFRLCESAGCISIPHWRCRLQALRARPGVAFATASQLARDFAQHLNGNELRAQRLRSAWLRMASLLPGCRCAGLRRCAYRLG